MAAAAGGVTTALEYPQASPPVRDLATLALKRGLAEAGAVIDFALWGGAIPVSLDHLEAIHDAGAIGFKGFMYSKNPEFPGIDDALLVRALTTVSRLAAYCRCTPRMERSWSTVLV